MLNKFTVAVTAFFVASLAFMGVTFAAAAGAAVADNTSLTDLARPVLDAILHGQYWAGAALLLVLGVAALRKYGSTRWPWLATGVGAALLVLAGAFGAAFATSLAAGALPTFALAETALKIAAAAAGGWSLLRSLIVPLIDWAKPKAPAWAAPFFALLVWAFEQPSAAEATIANSINAGVKAVDAKPAAGIAGVTGTATEIK